MAVPNGMAIRGMKGKFVVNKKISDTMDALFRVQDMPFIVGKITNLGTIHLDKFIEPAEPESIAGAGGPNAEGIDAALSEPAYQITMIQSLTSFGIFGMGPLKALGLAPVRVEPVRILDGRFFEHTEAVVGTTRGRWWIGTVDEVLADPRLDPEFHKGANFAKPGEGSREVIRMSFCSTRTDPKKFYAEHVWGFERHDSAPDNGLRYTGRMMVWRGEGANKEVAKVKLIHDYLGCPEKPKK